MKKWILAAAAVLLAASCEDFLPGQGGKETLLSWHFEPQLIPPTRSWSDIPDTNDFILTVSDARGNILYNGAYGRSPESLTVEPGSYDVEVKSVEFTAPAFDKPQYGDAKVIVVRNGEKADVSLDCYLRNAGVRLKIDPEFLTSYPRGALLLKSPEGKLMYSYSEKRTAFFKPGAVQLILSNDGKDQILTTREVKEREIWTIGLSAPGAATVNGKGFTLSLDTTKVWKSENLTLGGGSSGNSGGDDGGSDLSDALSVSMAKAAVGATDTWVYGYIVGGDLTTTGSKINTGPTFTKSTHLAIASRASVTEKAACLSVELPKGAVRDGLNLVDHPDLVGSRIYIKGNIVEPYFGITGVKGCTEYVLK